MMNGSVSVDRQSSQCRQITNENPKRPGHLFRTWSGLIIYFLSAFEEQFYWKSCNPYLHLEQRLHQPLLELKAVRDHNKACRVFLFFQNMSCSLRWGKNAQIFLIFSCDRIKCATEFGLCLMFYITILLPLYSSL